jgi:hypothetical protein
MGGSRVKLLPAEVKKIGSDSNSGQFAIRRTVATNRNWTLTLFSDLRFLRCVGLSGCSGYIYPNDESNYNN